MSLTENRRFDYNIRLNPRTRMPYADPRNFPALWTPQQKYVWEKATFTIPVDVSEERLQFNASKYRNAAGRAYELQGFRVLEVDGPHLDTSLVGRNIVDPDRKRYVIWLKVVRAPQVVRADVPDKDVPVYEQAGMKLVE